jgi:hypothetical protein
LEHPCKNICSARKAIIWSKLYDQTSTVDDTESTMTAQLMNNVDEPRDPPYSLKDDRKLALRILSVNYWKKVIKKTKVCVRVKLPLTLDQTLSET